jgi:hypothetical protein
MKTNAVDDRSDERRRRDEVIVAEAKLVLAKVPAGATGAPMEAFLARSSRRPLAIEGVVENGLVRPLDPTVILPESARDYCGDAADVARYPGAVTAHGVSLLL